MLKRATAHPGIGHTRGHVGGRCPARPPLALLACAATTLFACGGAPTPPAAPPVPTLGTDSLQTLSATAAGFSAEFSGCGVAPPPHHRHRLAAAGTGDAGVR